MQIPLGPTFLKIMIEKDKIYVVSVLIENKLYRKLVQVQDTGNRECNNCVRSWINCGTPCNQDILPEYSVQMCCNYHLTPCSLEVYPIIL